MNTAPDRQHQWPKSAKRGHRTTETVETCAVCPAKRRWSPGAERWIYNAPPVLMEPGALKHPPRCVPTPDDSIAALLASPLGVSLRPGPAFDRRIEKMRRAGMLLEDDPRMEDLSDDSPQHEGEV